MKSLQSVMFNYGFLILAVKLVLSFPLFIIDFWDSDIPPDGTPTVGKTVLCCPLFQKNMLHFVKYAFQSFSNLFPKK